MRKLSNFVRTDIAFLLMLVLIFTGMLFLAFDKYNITLNAVTMVVSCICLLITHYTKLITGLVIDALVIIVYVGYVFYLCISTGMSVPATAYFWIFWKPAMTLSLCWFTNQTRVLQNENKELVIQVNKLATIDEQLAIGNLRAFENDATVYMKISMRYKMNLVLMLWELPTNVEGMQSVSQESLREIAKGISGAIQRSLRTEDSIYLIDSTPYVWGTLLFTDPAAIEIVENRVKRGIDDIDFRYCSRFQRLPTELYTAFAKYDGEDITPFTLLASAKQLLNEKHPKVEE